MSLDTITTWIADVWWPFVQSATIGSLIVLLIVACVWSAIRRFASAHLGYALFLLPLIPFVLPLRGLLPLEVPLGGLASQIVPTLPVLESNGTAVPSDSVNAARSRAAQTMLAASSFVSDSNPSSSYDRGSTASTTQLASREPQVTWSWPLTIFCVWLAIVALLSWRWMLWQYRTQRLARRASPVRDARLRLLVRRTADRAGLRHVPRVVETTEIHSPAVCGIWRPTLLLPHGLGDWLAALIDEIVFVLHECVT